jgi:type II secretory pathway component GspD/PulD (secretin)
VRALKTQQRIDVLSRPQVMTMDGQTALISHTPIAGPHRQSAVRSGPRPPPDRA